MCILCFDCYKVVLVVTLSSLLHCNLNVCTCRLTLLLAAQVQALAGLVNMVAEEPCLAIMREPETLGGCAEHYECPESAW